MNMLVMLSLTQMATAGRVMEKLSHMVRGGQMARNGCHWLAYAYRGQKAIITI